jgi:hypothetical protein
MESNPTDPPTSDYEAHEKSMYKLLAEGNRRARTHFLEGIGIQGKSMYRTAKSAESTIFYQVNIAERRVAVLDRRHSVKARTVSKAKAGSTITILLLLDVTAFEFRSI